MQVSGGHLLPPVQKLVATIIFARPTQGQKCKSSPGSEGSAAGGRYSDPSEWQRSVCNAAAPSARRTPGTATGHRHQIMTIIAYHNDGHYFYAGNGT